MWDISGLRRKNAAPGSGGGNRIGANQKTRFGVALEYGYIDVAFEAEIDDKAVVCFVGLLNMDDGAAGATWMASNGSVGYWEVFILLNKNIFACSKEDNSLAKTEKAISDALEREFGLINISRAAALSSTDGRDGGKLLTFSGGDFSWTDIKMDDLNFIPISAIETDECDLKNVREWIDSH
uniref:Signal recognition particle receptor subunit beta n=1 Tax=Panagrolaimus davidi TaxID=227884 RepID=A0A914Q3B7_9BILA